MYYFSINVRINFFVFIVVLNSVKSLRANSNYSYNISEPARLNDVSVRHKRQMDSKKNVYSSMALSTAFVTLKCGLGVLQQQINSPILVTAKMPNACKINVTELDLKQALIIDPFDHSKFIYPDSEGIISFFEDEPVFLSCPHAPAGQKKFLRPLPYLYYQTFSCVCGKIFMAGEEFFDFHDLICNIYPKHDIIDKGVTDVVDLVDQVLINDRYHKYEIGFRVDDDNNFVKIIDVIYNDETLSTHYVKSTISRYKAGGQRTQVQRPMIFNKKYCCGNLLNYVNMDNVYRSETQEASFLLQLKDQAKLEPKDRYLNKDTNYLFNRGHLTHKASMIYTAAAMATYAYLNVVPQWIRINNGNWAKIENHIVHMAIELEKDLQVITGAFGQLQYKDTSDGNKMRPMYLYYARQREINVKMIPIPLYMFKLVIEPHSRRGVVYVTVNDPYAPDDLPKLCDEPRTEIATVRNPKWDNTKKELGISYMCRVSDFLRRFSKFSTIDVKLVYNVTEFLCIPEGCDYNIDPSDESLITTTSTTTVAPVTIPADTTTKLIHDELKRRDLENNMWLMNYGFYLHEPYHQEHM